jgi:hypothetical protein
VAKDLAHAVGDDQRARDWIEALCAFEYAHLATTLRE